jgi:outer membrane cobalamin receptor
MPLTRLASLLALAALAAVAPVRATDDPSAADEPRDSGVEETVDVAAEGPDLPETTAFTTPVETDGLAARGDDVGSLLRAVPGARVRSLGGLGRFATVSLRGSAADQVVVLLDGVPLNRGFGGAVDLSLVPVSALERITVYRGFPPASAGLSGLGGLVDIRTAAPDDGRSLEVSALAGSLGTRRLAFAGATALPRGMALRVGVESFEADGDFTYYDDGGTEHTLVDDDPDAVRHNNATDALALFAALQVERALGGSLAVTLRHADREQGIPGVGTLRSRSARLDERVNSAHARWARSAAVGAELEVGVDAFDRRARFHDPERHIGVGAHQQTTRISGGGASVVVRGEAGRHRLLGRVDARLERARVRQETLAVPDRGGARRFVAGVVLEDVVPVGGWLLTPAVRWEWRRDDFLERGGGLPAPAADVTDPELTARIGVARPLGGRWTLRGSAGRFHHPPSLVELFGHHGAIVGNPELRPEQGAKVEVGVARARGRTRRSGELVAFATRAEDLITFVANSQGTAIARNIGVAEIVGIEASASWAGPGGLTLTGSATLQDAEDASGGVADGRPLVGQPERMAYAGALWRRGRWDAGWELHYVGENAASPPDFHELRLPARVLHDVRFGWTHRSGVRVGVEVDNVFDREAVDVARFPLPGRLLFVSINWRTARTTR